MHETAAPTATPTVADVTQQPFGVAIRVVTELALPAAEVWAALTATDRYPAWNPFVTRLDGRLTEGARLRVTVAVPGRRPMVLRPRVVEVRPGRTFAWRGRLGLPGLLDGTHRFTVEPTGEDTSQLVHEERLTGLLVPLLRRLLAEDTPRGFVAMNDALAARLAEHG
jgi:hypothetical protein